MAFSQQSGRNVFGRASRAIVTAGLALALLCAALPAGAFSSSARECRMACCALKPPHLAGECDKVSCHALPPSARGEAESSHAHAGGETAQADGGGRHSHHAPEAGGDTSRPDGPRRGTSGPAAAPAAALDAPCLPGCGAAANNFNTRPRFKDAAALSHAARPRPPTLANTARAARGKLFAARERRGRIRPRAPPSDIQTPTT